ncbi:MAG: hypothetical protein IPO95_15890 [Rhodanobacteraceae bacterium]|nr:hypothetical protein [Rhodanobacteraceae bacterium]
MLMPLAATRVDQRRQVVDETRMADDQQLCFAASHRVEGRRRRCDFGRAGPASAQDRDFVSGPGREREAVGAIGVGAAFDEVDHALAVAEHDDVAIGAVDDVALRARAGGDGEVDWLFAQRQSALVVDPKAFDIDHVGRESGVVREFHGQGVATTDHRLRGNLRLEVLCDDAVETGTSDFDAVEQEARAVVVAAAGIIEAAGEADGQRGDTDVPSRHRFEGIDRPGRRGPAADQSCRRPRIFALRAVVVFAVLRDLGADVDAVGAVQGSVDADIRESRGAATVDLQAIRRRVGVQAVVDGAPVEFDRRAGAERTAAANDQGNLVGAEAERQLA